MIPAAELLNIQAQLTQSEQGVIAAQNNYEIALLQLKQLLRLDPLEDIRVEVPEDVEIATNPDLITFDELLNYCLLYTSPSPRDLSTSRMPSSA